MPAGHEFIDWNIRIIPERGRVHHIDIVGVVTDHHHPVAGVPFLPILFRRNAGGFPRLNADQYRKPPVNQFLQSVERHIAVLRHFEPVLGHAAVDVADSGMIFGVQIFRQNIFAALDSVIHQD
ncbi:hypothetical protein SDC9_184343 [bioreactor metagenome]|uniref:Uncharacterized protein n=1 Tax=bioreactor metagenome TaxID=1076179 RepID=A0A645HCS5_9ZZZZ